MSYCSSAYDAIPRVAQDHVGTTRIVSWCSASPISHWAVSHQTNLTISTGNKALGTGEQGLPWEQESRNCCVRTAVEEHKQKRLILDEKNRSFNSSRDGPGTGTTEQRLPQRRRLVKKSYWRTCFAMDKGEHVLP